MARMTKEAKAIEKAKRTARLVAAQGIVAKGVCPTCGTHLHRNLSLAGWWQCGRLGAPGFQKVAGPRCDFQIFYDVTPQEHAEVMAAKAGVR